MQLPWQTSDLHPHALSLDDDALNVDDFAVQLAQDLAQMSPPETIHRYRIVAQAGQQDATLMANGFTAVRLTHMVDLPITVLDHPALAAPLPDTLNAHWFQRGDRAPWTNWIDAHWRHYVITHASNPPRIPRCGLRAIFVGTDLVEGLALREGPQGRVRGFASLRKGEELGWIGGAGDLLVHVLALSLRRAVTIGWTKLMIEVDDDDRALWALIGSLGVPVSQAYVTWQRERNPANRPS